MTRRKESGQAAGQIQRLSLGWALLCLLVTTVRGQVLNPPYFNLAEGRKITATATCGEGVPERELYCKLVGANADRQDNPNINLIQGQLCNYCDPNDPNLAHPPEHAIDGTEKWWQSPPLSRANKYNQVNLTIDLGQEFHVAYVFIKMGISPRPGVWALERSTDGGQTYRPWQYFADTPGDCVQYFGNDSLQPLTKDDSVVCETKFSKVVPLEGGEIVVSLLNDRPSAEDFIHSSVLQEWTKATNVRLRFIRTKTLLGHLMSVVRQDPTVTRRYFYSIKDINIGGRCVCNGHAETCDLTDPSDPYKLLCRCQHNTCGPQCEQCCPGFVQKKWRRALVDNPNACERCNCFGHARGCVYDENIDKLGLSLDIHGNYRGGGVCQNCEHNTEGINCNRCKPGFFRPYDKPLNVTDVCQLCQCDLTFSTGNCADGNGQCECRPEFLPPYCDQCNIGYYGYPQCRPCDCNVNGTEGNICEVGGGQCPCKPNYTGKNCNKCAQGYYGFPDCLPCDCHGIGATSSECDVETGQCSCRTNYGGRQCSMCDVGFYNYPLCQLCSCDPIGSTEDICNQTTGDCLCHSGFGLPRCDICAPGYFGFPDCIECGCDEQGSVSSVCDSTGKCRCLVNFSGKKCDQCSPGYYNYPECLACNCDVAGSQGVSCKDDGQCFCRSNFDGEKCGQCREGFYNYPRCEECNCNPAGVLATFGGCGSLTSGELCECKERVTGRICDTCRPLFWNLQAGNPVGCEECDCYGPGTIGGASLCDGVSGQCICKPNVISRQCQECKDGSYRLEEDNLFGCQDCQCDIGGSENNVCDKNTGKCACRPRINGRRCDKPLQTHYFPSLHQLQYELEDGRTPSDTPVRFGYDQSQFGDYSWRGYAIFSDIQKEILLRIYVEKSSLYHVLFRYHNFGGENIYGFVKFTPEASGETEQSSDVVFKSTDEPKFVLVSGKQGLIASPFVLNPGRWTVSIKVEKPLFVDYLVLLPQAYFEATLLQEEVNSPCKIGSTSGLCRHFRYPGLTEKSDIVKGEAAYVAVGDQRTKAKMFTEEAVLTELGTGPMAWLNKDQMSLKLDLQINRPGRHILVILYHTPEGGETTNLMVDVATENQMDKGRAILYDCSYSFVCRQAVIDRMGKLAVFDFDSNYASVTLEMDRNDGSNIAIDSIVAIPLEEWEIDYTIPQSQCVKQDGKCMESHFPLSVEATKVEFESGQNENRIATELPSTLGDQQVKLIYLDHDDPMVDIHGSVPAAGSYVIVVHYYQPDHPAYDMKVLIQNGQFYEAILPVMHCPSVSGCRSVVKEVNTNSDIFSILENFVLTLKEPDHKGIWVDYVLAIPADQFDENLLHPIKQEQAGRFVTECNKDHFSISPDVQGFCRDAVYSLTAEYNNGALPCQCDIDGSLSFECEEFGGQCKCKPNVIGRTCAQCRTGYFGFPDCQPCDCPSTAVCHPVTGQCICPPRVTGERCDSCESYTYGFDAIIGCEECNCNPLGVYRGNLQCDLLTGMCPCKSNVVGRKCDRCKPGYWGFPNCRLCNCDLRGTTENICDQRTAECFCKENVYGHFCEQCKPGTFHLEENNPLGCTKCFCFGATDRCSSAYMFRSKVVSMNGWKGVGLVIDNQVGKADLGVQIEESGSTVRAYIPEELPTGSLFYFKAPSTYLGNMITAYGGELSYTVTTVVDQQKTFGGLVGPDVVLIGNNVTLVHGHLEQPAANLPLEVTMNIVETEFRRLSGSEVSRELMMMVLVNLDGLYIRGSYFQPVQEVRLATVMLDAADEGPIADSSQALRVERCQCPVQYEGTSCEKCAPKYYRSKTGPYLGFCQECQCNNHADSCDVNTGECLNCKHNTVGKHCEQCAPGYHGDATRGTPNDCLICACPRPTESNNFAVSCEVSESGLEISCNCKPGYTGPRCGSCSAGYFGQPQVLGSYCQSCNCSGNSKSCDSITGECHSCLNNTFGTACELCASGFYGDAVFKKDCKKCECNECGTDRCDHRIGVCHCKPNVVGMACDDCDVGFWGFKSCVGCQGCNCGPASEDNNCDVETGQCKCRPGTTGLTCDSCKPGYWQYSPEGCVSCNCVEKYSLPGAVCDVASGECQCLPGVVGTNCQGCLYRWTFIENQGCQECGPCVHALLDETDYLQSLIDPIRDEMTDISASYFAYRRLHNVNKTVDDLRPEVNALIFDPTAVDLSPLHYNVRSVEDQAHQLNNSADKGVKEAEEVSMNADKTREEALEVEKLIQDAVKKARDTVGELTALAEGLLDTAGPNLDKLIARAERILQEIKDRDFMSRKNDTEDELELAEELLEHVKNFQKPAILNKERAEELDEQLNKLNELLEELRNHSRDAEDVAQETLELNEAIRQANVTGIIAAINQLAAGTNKTLDEAKELLEAAKKALEDAETAFSKLDLDSSRLARAIDELKEKLNGQEEELDEVRPLVDEAKKHASDLMEQAALLDSLLADTRDSADGAVKAATAYGNIVDAIDDALKAAQAAVEAANQAAELSDGMAGRAEGSKNRSIELLEEAQKLQKKVEDALYPQLEQAKAGVQMVAEQNGKTDRELDIIQKELDKLPYRSLEIIAQEAANNSLAAEAKAKGALDRVQDITEKLPEDEKRANQVPQDYEDAKHALEAADNYVHRALAIVPNITVAMKKVGDKNKIVSRLGTDVADKIAELRRKVELARDQANRIKVGVRFYGNTTLQLRNPTDMKRAATYTYMSLYFRTEEKNGLLAYVGNEIGTNKYLKNVNTDDFMALEIVDGKVVLTMELGSGLDSTFSTTNVNDGQWHRATVERTGKIGTLTVQTDAGEEGIKNDVSEIHIPGTFSVFNLNENASKLYIGGIPEAAKIQKDVQTRTFTGCIEEVDFGETPVGLWNFVKAQNNFEGCVGRDKLVTLVTSNGLRFDGRGYAIMPGERHNFAREIIVILEFKTYAEEGLLFLVENGNNFFALELQEGRLFSKLMLDGNLVVLKSPNVYNNGSWHRVEAKRVGKDTLLSINSVEVDSGLASEVELQKTRDIYVGGYPGGHTHTEITNVNFEGCIQNLQIGTANEDLNKNKEALGVVPGCPATIARTVSFSNESPGYVAMRRTSMKSHLNKYAQLTFKFKTVEPDGLIFYAADEEQSSYLSIALADGHLVMKSNPGGEIRTATSKKYNDKNWHYVTATKTLHQLRLDIDDLYDFNQETSDKNEISITTPLYFGGVPQDYVIKPQAAASVKTFIGCIGDTTVNNQFQNFADSQDRPGSSLTSCPLADPDEVTTEPPVVDYSTVSPDHTEEETTEDQEIQKPDFDIFTTLLPTTTLPTTLEPTVPYPTPYGLCKLPISPLSDPDVTAEDGMRYGNSPWARREFYVRTSTLLDESTFSLEFKTDLPDGAMFYVSGSDHIDFIALYLRNRKVFFAFDCGGGAGRASTNENYNDGDWHSVKFSRRGRNGQLEVDGREVIEVKSLGSPNSLNVRAPVYIGGLSEDTARKAKNNLQDVVTPFPGCMRNIRVQEEVLNKPKLTERVEPCSDKVEGGTYFPYSGSYIRLYDSYRVGQKVAIRIDIKPRHNSGIIMAVHSSYDFMLLQMVEGKVMFSVENGAGIISVTFEPLNGNSYWLCDGYWHNIQAVKTKNVVTLSIDGHSSTPGIGQAGVSSTDTKDPLYVGGVPDPTGLRGMNTMQNFVGCMRYVELNGVIQKLVDGRAFGNVTLNSCPTI